MGYQARADHCRAHLATGTWLRQNEETVLEITYSPNNYPSLYVQTVNKLDEQIAAHINMKLGGWKVIKNNLHGDVQLNVNGDTGEIIEALSLVAV